MYPLTTGGCLRIFPERSSTYFGGGVVFSPDPPPRQRDRHVLRLNPHPRPPPLRIALRRMPRAADDRARRDDREPRASVDPARPPLLPERPHLGRERVPDHFRQPAAPGRSPRRPAGPQA